MFKKILVPTDGSELSEKAVAGAIDYAKNTGATLIALGVSVLWEPYLYGDAWSANLPVIMEESKKLTSETLAAAARAFEAAGIPHETVFAVDEHPWRVILETAKQHGCDAIFMASHGRRGFDALVLGSETHKVLTHATLPVLVFR
jgi:nucleotide-binding universal stress UspA family protein